MVSMWSTYGQYMVIICHNRDLLGYGTCLTNNVISNYSLVKVYIAMENHHFQ